MYKLAPVLFVLALFTAYAAVADGHAKDEKKADDAGWVDLFNGKDLKGWKNPYEWGEAKVVDGVIELTANKKFFLTTEKQFSDFELEVAVVGLHPRGKGLGGFFHRTFDPVQLARFSIHCEDNVQPQEIDVLLVRDDRRDILHQVGRRAVVTVAATDLINRVLDTGIDKRQVPMRHRIRRRHQVGFVGNPVVLGRALLLVNALPEQGDCVNFLATGLDRGFVVSLSQAFVE